MIEDQVEQIEAMLTSLLAAALRDPDLMSSQVRHLERWIDIRAATPAPP